MYIYMHFIQCLHLSSYLFQRTEEIEFMVSEIPDKHSKQTW